MTIGRGSGIESFVWEYDDHGIHSTVVAVNPYSHEDRAFSSPGNSGSIVADGKDVSSASSSAVPAGLMIST